VFVVGVCSFGFELEKICSGGAEEEEEGAEFQSLFGGCGKRFKVEREREREREREASDDRRWSGGYRAGEEETRMKHGEQQGNCATTSSATFV
jgi:hypothetical protein